MKPRHKKLVMIVSGVTALGVAAILVLNAFQSNLVFFFSPSQVIANEAPIGKSFRIGGLVAEGSVKRDDGSTTVHFSVTDTAETIPVVYTGILPDLFREGKGWLRKEKYLLKVFFWLMKFLLSTMKIICRLRLPKL